MKTATEKLQALSRAVAAEMPRFQKQAETLAGATTLMRETKTSHVSDAIYAAAKRAAFRKMEA